jgi:hypothetical protein
MTDQSDWHKRIDDGMEDIRRESADGSAFQVNLIPCWRVMEAYDKARAGDVEAGQLAACIDGYMNTLLQADSEGGGALCGCCQQPLARGKIGGFVVLIPLEVGKTGIASGFCDNCRKRGPKYVEETTLAYLLQMLGLEMKGTH